MTTTNSEKNSVMDTARLTLSSLGISGVIEAKEFAKKFGFEDDLFRYHDTSSGIAHSTMIEARFEFLNQQIEKIGNKNILDIACGFSPRGLRFARKGYKYIGIDLQDAATAMGKLASEFSGNEELTGSFDYHLVNATNSKELAAIGNLFEGEVTITCEGLFMYLKPSEVENLILGMKSILEKNGGCFVTPDFASFEIYKIVYGSIFGKDAGMNAVTKSLEDTEKKLGISFTDSLLWIDDNKAYDFFSKFGLSIERIPYIENDFNLKSYEKLEKNQIDALRNGLNNNIAWKVTLK